VDRAEAVKMRWVGRRLWTRVDLRGGFGDEMGGEEAVESR
jgi:hypothetical protein